MYKQLLIITSIIFLPNFTPAFAKEPPTLEVFEDYIEGLKVVQSHYIKPKSLKTLVKTSFKTLVKSLDPHSLYLEKDEFQDLQRETTGRYFGLGFITKETKKGLLIMHVIDGSSAKKMQLTKGDLIVKINSRDANQINLNKELKKKSKQIQLLVQKNRGSKPIQLKLEKSLISSESVRCTSKENKTIYCQIHIFDDATSAQFLKAIQTKTYSHLVLDLRDNPGGLLTEAIKMADYFIGEGIILSVRSHNPKDKKIYFSRKEKKLKQFKQVYLLMNKDTASAAEIFIGALLKHNPKFKSYGEKTYGKGSVQEIIPLQNGDALKLTIGEYYIGDKVKINEVGIQPLETAEDWYVHCKKHLKSKTQCAGRS